MPNLNESEAFRRDEVLSSALQGRTESVGELLESYRAYLNMLAASRLRGRFPSRISPSDVVQEAMLAAHRAIGDFRGETTAEFSAWMRRILTHKIISCMDRHLSLKRDARREVSIEGPCGRSGGSPAPTFMGTLSTADPSPSTIAVRREDCQRIAELLEHLPPHYREVILLRNQGHHFEAIAPQLNRSPVATRLLWLRAIQRLRKLYDMEQLSEPKR